jgi:hypothetical protein
VQGPSLKHVMLMSEELWKIINTRIFAACLQIISRNICFSPVISMFGICVRIWHEVSKMEAWHMSSVDPHTSSPKLANGFRINLVLRVCTDSCRVTWSVSNLRFSWLLEIRVWSPCNLVGVLKRL